LAVVPPMSNAITLSILSVRHTACVPMTPAAGPDSSIRTHCRRLTRLSLGFSKKLENFKASMDLYFAFYNFVRFHKTISCTPAQQAGVLSSALSVGDLVDMAA